MFSLKTCQSDKRSGRGARLDPLQRLLPSRCRSGAAGALVAFLSAALGVWLFWGFTVDDALITARIAHHLHEGLGYRYNPTGPAVDAVTPFGWVYLLAPFASTPWNAWLAARWIGVTTWLLSAAWLGREIRGTGGSLLPLVLLAGLAPIGAWTSSGMETGFVIALVTLSTSRRSWGLAPAAIAAALRPELVPFAVVLAAGRATALREVARNVAAALGPALLVALLRNVLFGSPYPLSAAAKPADLSFGVFYVLQTLLLGGPFWLWLGPGWRNLPREERALVLAIAAHLLGLVLVGGDWMVLLRLATPVFPAVLRVASQLKGSRSPAWKYPGWVCAIVATAYLATNVGLAGKRIVRQRQQLIRSVESTLSEDQVAAGLDIGWLGVAHRGTVVDLAGVTDPRVAHLAGGHTTKRIDEGWFRTRGIDRLLLLLAPGDSVASEWERSRFARVVESRVARFARDLDCSPLQTVPLPETNQRYLVVSCKRQR